MRAAHLLTATAAAAALTLAGCGSSESPSPASTGGSPSQAGPRPVPASGGWAAPADASAAAKAAGLPMLGEEKLAVHYHAHVDVLVDGQPVAVPPGIGVDETRHLISPLHTHDASGVVHIESARDVPFTLGQLFAEWGQPLRADQVGPVALTNGETLRVYKDGQQVTGDPANLRFSSHNEIVIWIGPGNQQPQVPSSYSFPPGE